MLPDRVSNPGSLTYESGALPIALVVRGPIFSYHCLCGIQSNVYVYMLVPAELKINIDTINKQLFCLVRFES